MISRGVLPAGLFGALVAGLVACSMSPTSAPARVRPGHAVTLPDARAVPAEALNPDVRQETIQQTTCVPGYTESVRPSTSYTNGVKAKLLREQGLPATDSQRFELDHRIPLSLGGHPRTLANLQLQAWEGPRGAKSKDVVERRLQVQVCAGRLLLADAQRYIHFDWAGN